MNVVRFTEKGQVESVGIFSIVVQQMVKFLLMMVTGIICVKVGLLKEAGLNVLSKLAMRVLLPVFILYNTLATASRETIISSFIVIPLSMALFAFNIAGSTILAKLSGLKGERSRVFRALFTFGNMGLVGIPFISAVYPEEGMLFIALYTIVDQLLLWTYGYKLTAGANEKMTVKNLKNMISPGLVAIVLGLVLVMVGVPIPDVLLDTMKSIGTASTPVALIFVGGSVCYCDIKSILKSRDLYFGVIGKMIIIPTIACLAFGRLIGIDSTTVMIMAMIIGLPSMTVIPMMARENPESTEGEYASGITMLTQLCCIITLPVVTLIGSAIL